MGTITIFLVFPNIKSLQLEEIGAIFSDTDDIAVFPSEIEVHPNSHALVDHHA
jgi:hypothetical protein